MPLDSAERLYLERQVTLARAVLVALALVALLEMSGTTQRPASVLFLAAYLVVALAVVVYQRIVGEGHFQIPLALSLIHIFRLAPIAAPLRHPRALVRE